MCGSVLCDVLGSARLGLAMPAARLCSTWLSYARLCYTRLGYARLCSAWLCSAMLCSARLGYARLCSTWLGSAQLGLGYARLGSARLGSARLATVISCYGILVWPDCSTLEVYQLFLRFLFTFLQVICASLEANQHLPFPRKRNVHWEPWINLLKKKKN